VTTNTKLKFVVASMTVLAPPRREYPKKHTAPIARTEYFALGLLMKSMYGQTCCRYFSSQISIPEIQLLVTTFSQ